LPTPYFAAAAELKNKDHNKSLNRSMAVSKAAIITLLFWAAALTASAKGRPDQNMVRSVLLLKIAENIEWPAPALRDSFSIAFASRDTAMLRQLKYASVNKTIAGKPIIITNIGLADIPLELNLIYIGPDEAPRAEKYWEKTAQAGLVVTEGSANPLYSMVHLKLDASGVFSFAANSPAIKSAGLRPMPNLLLAGGSEVDLRQMYRATKSLLDELEAKHSKLEEEFFLKQKQILSQEKQINLQNKMLAQQQDELSEQISEINIKAGILGFMAAEKLQRQAIIDSLFSIIEAHKSDIEAQQQEEILSLARLDWLNKAMAQISEEIEDKKEKLQIKQTALNEKEEIIASQQKYIYSAVSAAGLAALAIFFMVFAYRVKTQANLDLDKKNAELLFQQDEIRQQAEELSSINSQLSRQRDQLVGALKQLRDTQDQLVHSEKLAALGTFTAGVAHEINNPLNFIASGIEGIKLAASPLAQLARELAAGNSPEAAKAKELIADGTLEGLALMLNSLQEGTERATNIVSSLNSFSRTGGQHTSLYDIAYSIDTALMIISGQTKERIIIEKNLGWLAKIECYPAKIDQVLVNIIANSAQAITGKGKITITGKMLGAEAVEICIADTGSGIKKEDMPHIFEPFFTTKEVGKGTGLGLAISYSVVEQHGGTITAESAEAAGTCFKIVLPVKYPAQDVF
jgi:signal transduction histidine kinase